MITSLTIIHSSVPAELINCYYSNCTFGGHLRKVADWHLIELLRRLKQERLDPPLSFIVATFLFDNNPKNLLNFSLLFCLHTDVPIQGPSFYFIDEGFYLLNYKCNYIYLLLIRCSALNDICGLFSIKKKKITLLLSFSKTKKTGDRPQTSFWGWGYFLGCLLLKLDVLFLFFSIADTDTSPYFLLFSFNLIFLVTNFE